MDMSLTQAYECQEDRVVGLVAALKFWISLGAGGESVIFNFFFFWETKTHTHTHTHTHTQGRGKE